MDETRDWYRQLLRGFLSSSHCAFVEAETLLPQWREDDPRRREFLFHQSQLHRSNLDTLLGEIDAFGGSIERERESETHADRQRDLESATAWLEDEVLRVERLRNSWRLAEIIMLNPQRFVVVEFVSWLQSLVYPVPPDALTPHSTHPETSAQYWPAVYALAMRGEFTQLAHALATHSELSLALSVTPLPTQTLGVLTTREKERELSRQKTRFECEALLDLFRTHPFVAYTQHTHTTHTQSHTHTQAVAEKEREKYLESHMLARWREKVEIVRESAFAMRMPELDTLFRILLGEKECLRVMCNGDWAVLCVSVCLFVYAGTLSRANIARIVDDCLSVVQAGEKTDPRLHDDFCELLGGVVGPALQSLREASLSLSSPSDREKENVLREHAMMSLSATAHLTHLLAHCGQCRELTQPLRDGDTLLSQILLDVARFANDLLLPVQMISECLSVCTDHGREALAKLLTEREIHSDDEAIEIAQYLRLSHCVAEARDVLVERARHWLQSAALPALRRSVAENVVMFEAVLDVDGPDSSSEALGRAGRCLWHAAHIDALVALLDVSFSRVAQSVRMCDNVNAFAGLDMFPGQPADGWTRRAKKDTERCPEEQRLLSADELDSFNSFHDDLRDLSQCALTPSLSLSLPSKQTLLSHSFYGDFSPTETAMKRTWTAEEKETMLLYALREAESLTACLAAYDKHHWDAFPAISQGFDALSQYCVAVRAVLAAQSETSAVESVREWRVAASAVSNVLLAHNDRSPAVNVRYWLHLLDLAVWIHAHIAQRELSQSLDPQFLAQRDAERETARESERETEKWCRGAYSLTETQRFHDLFQILLKTQQDLAESAKSRETRPCGPHAAHAAGEYLFALCGATQRRRNALHSALRDLLRSATALEQVALREKARFPANVAALQSKLLQIRSSGTAGGMGLSLVVRAARDAPGERARETERETQQSKSMFSPPRSAFKRLKAL